MRTPDVLVLGAGGTLGEAWMSAVLTGMEEAGEFDARGCARYVGTSAGSIVAASLAAGFAPGAHIDQPSRPGDARSESLDGDEAFRQALAFRGAFASAAGAAAAPAVSLAFASSAAAGAIVRRILLRGVRPGRQSLAELGRKVELAGVRWDGRLRIVAVELESGRRVVFGAPGAPELSPSLAVQASCAIPGYFRPIAAGGRTYVDGGAWSLTNMDAAEAAGGEQVLCLNPTGSMRPSAVLTGALGRASRAIAAAEALLLRGRGARVRTINPDRASAEAMGANLMDPRRRRSVIEAGLAQGRRLATRAPSHTAVPVAR